MLCRNPGLLVKRWGWCLPIATRIWRSITASTLIFTGTGSWSAQKSTWLRTVLLTNDWFRHRTCPALLLVLLSSCLPVSHGPWKSQCKSCGLLPALYWPMLCCPNSVTPSYPHSRSNFPENRKCHRMPGCTLSRLQMECRTCSPSVKRELNGWPFALSSLFRRQVGLFLWKSTLNALMYLKLQHLQVFFLLHVFRWYRRPECPQPGFFSFLHPWWFCTWQNWTLCLCDTFCNHPMLLCRE